MKKVIAALVGVTALVAATVAVGIASAQTLNNPGEATGCTDGTWHFVHNQTSATSGTLTAVIGGQTYTATNGPPFSSNNLHYYINVTGATTPLGAISDSVPGGKLVLSDCPRGSVPPPPPPPPGPPPPPPGPPPVIG